MYWLVGWMDLVLSWEEEEQNGIQKTVLATEWKWNDLDFFMIDIRSFL